MDLIYLAITAALLLLTWGLMKICELPPTVTKSSSAEEQKFDLSVEEQSQILKPAIPNPASQAGGKS